GRVESHCLGCERAFDGEHAQGIAEKVFTQLARSHPNKPQVYYLLGYLRQEQERYDEARTHYLTAVRLDPDYLNAWVRLQEVSEQTLVSPQERDEIIFNILRLDPLQKHAHVDFDHVSNLNRLWNAMADAASHQPPRASNLFTLSASKTVLEKKEAEPASSLQAMQFGMMERIQMERENLSPAFILGQTPFVHIAGEMIVNGNNDPESE
ncbi:MAG TPA: tetratricopeptide repeat protein, partial [Opitutaceae bacterium]|nr:tetratricopeptide repeat protein [Opitutaceae bacterium]